MYIYRHVLYNMRYISYGHGIGSHSPEATSLSFDVDPKSHLALNWVTQYSNICEII
jgi:hypothetical protein